MMDEKIWTCSICLSDKDYPISLYPCGHSIGKDCCLKIQYCPECREKIISYAPNYGLGALAKLDYTIKRPTTDVAINVEYRYIVNERYKISFGKCVIIMTIIVFICNLAYIIPLGTIDYINDKESYLVGATCSIIDCSVEQRLCDNLAPCSTIHLKLQLNDYQKNIDKDVNYYIENWCINKTTIPCYYDNIDISTLSLDKIQIIHHGDSPLIFFILFILIFGIVINLLVSIFIGLIMVMCFSICNCCNRIITFN